MGSAIQQVVPTVMVVAVCLSAQIGLLALGSSFRVAARMAAPTPVSVAPASVQGSRAIQIAASRGFDGRW